MCTTAVTNTEDVARPFVVAHRAGNDLHRLQAATALGLPLAEADVHLYRGRLEVRHLKTAGPLPLLWDRWEVASPRTPRLELEALLEAAAGGPELMLDLKGHRPELTRRVLEALAARGTGRRVTVCSQDWDLLEPLRDTGGVRVVHSVGSARALRALHRRFAAERLAGVSIHGRLVDPASARALAARAELILSWPVETEAEGRRLAALDVDGLISQAFGELSAALAEPAQMMRRAA
jgi:glycerophosphoryl diester phosphodiesterase